MVDSGPCTRGPTPTGPQTATTDPAVAAAMATPPGEEHERRLGWMLDAEIETTFSMNLDRAGEGADRLEGVLSDLVHDSSKALVDKQKSVRKDAGIVGSSDAA